MRRIAAAVTVLMSVVVGLTATPAVATPAPPVAGAFIPLASPARLMDTRSGSQHVGPNGTLGASQTVDLQIAGQGGIPASDVGAIALNVTVTNPTCAGYLTLFPAGGPTPDASSLNFVPGQTVPNAVTVGLSASGVLSIFNNCGDTDVIIDATGYYVGGTAQDAGTFTPIAPTRMMDTRPDATGASSTLGPQDVVSLQVADGTDVPADAGAVVMNVTALNATENSFVTVYPDGGSQPSTSNLNFSPGQVTANQVTVAVGPGGYVDFFNNTGNVDVLADIAGYYRGGTATVPGAFVPTKPSRVFDSRGPSRFSNVRSTLHAGEPAIVDPSYSFNGVPANGVAALATNLTATNTTVDGYIAAYPTATPIPPSSNLNVLANQTVTNAATTSVGSADGTESFYLDAGSSDLIVDVFGYFIAAPTTWSWSAHHDAALDSATGELTAVSCSSPTFCVAAEKASTGLVKMFDGSTWSAATTADPDAELWSVSCVSASFCAAGDKAGGLVVFNGSSWSQPVALGTGVDNVSVSCMHLTFCAAVDTQGNSAIFNGTSWLPSPAPSQSTPLVALTCPRNPMPHDGYCNAYPASGVWWFYYQPYMGWVAGYQTVKANSASCTPRACVVEDGAGNAVAYSSSASLASQAIDAAGTATTDVSCGGNECMVVDAAGNAIRFDGLVWSSPTKVTPNGDLQAISCPIATWCMAVGSDNGYQVEVTGTRN